MIVFPIDTGAKVTQAREYLGMNKLELAAALGLAATSGRQTVRRWEEDNPSALGSLAIEALVRQKRGSGLTPERALLWRQTVATVIATEPQRRAFAAGFNGYPCPSPASSQMREKFELGRAVLAECKGEDH